MSDVDVNTEHAVDMPNDEELEAKDEKPKDSMSLKDFVIEVVCSEKILLMLGLTAIALDPLFFYVPMMKSNSTCLGLDKTLIIAVVILRTLVDILHDVSWWSKSHRNRSQYSRNKRVTRNPLTCVDRLKNLLKWFRSCKIGSPTGRSSVPARAIAILACLPLPQVVVLAVDFQSHLKTWIKFVVICQSVPRIFRTYPTYVAVTTSSDIYVWIGAAFNLLLFVFTGHALGGFWYLRAVERKIDCLKGACRDHSGCIESSLYCESGNFVDNGFLNDICAAQPTSNSTTPFDYGMYVDAITSNVIGSNDFINKLTYGFWWGLKNLSSMGQNLEFSGYIWDTCFAILICILGLFLFALLIGNSQVYLQSKMPSTLARLKEKREELDKWAPFSSLPHYLRKEVSMCQHRKWQEASEVNLESLLNNIPWKLKKKLKPHFCKKIFHKVKEFENLNKDIKEELRERARPVVFQARTNIHQEGYPINEMIHIVQGKVLTYNNNIVKEGLPWNELKTDDFFGEELLQGALESPLPKLPLATRSVQSVTKVEAFALSFHDFAATFTRHGRFLESYKKEWAAQAITSAFKKNTNINKCRKPSQEGKEQSINGKKSLQMARITPSPHNLDSN